MDLTSLYIFIGLVILGVIFVIISYLEHQAVIDDLKQFTKYKFISILIFVIGIIVHTLGEVIGYDTPLQMQMETAGHFIIMIGAIILIIQAWNLLQLAGEYGYD